MTAWQIILCVVLGSGIWSFFKFIIYAIVNGADEKRKIEKQHEMEEYYKTIMDELKSGKLKAYKVVLKNDDDGGDDDGLE